MSADAARPSPWYRNSWPWFIVILLSISVIASLATVTIAYRLGNLEAPLDEPGTRVDLQKTEPGIGVAVDPMATSRRVD